jgi:hypothetical protein
MILTHETNELTLSNVGTPGEFRIKQSAAAFRILSSSLYSNKIKAIMRELSTNALDSHIGAGKADLPFEVHLPAVFEPWFAVRDFGMGLDGDQVINVYSTYFESTKSDSNEFIGGLGLGSKSPFSYTENFTVTAIKNGYKRIYSAFINDLGVPSIAEMAEELTDEGNGVEVKFSVTNKNDYQSFKHEAQDVFKWFKIQPIITGQDCAILPVVYKEKDIIPGVHLIDTNHSRSSVAIMGNIAYPISDIPEALKHFGDLARLLNNALVIEFNIGELDFAASREQLSFIPLTLDSIKKKLELLNASLIINVEQQVKEFTNEWQKAEFLYKKRTINLYNAAVKQYMINTKFPLYDDKDYYGKKTFKLGLAEMKDRRITICGFGISSQKIRNFKVASEYNAALHNSYYYYTGIPVNESVIIVLDDIKTSCSARAKYHYGVGNNYKNNVSVYCISHESDDLTIRQAAYDILIKELHTPPQILYASELNKPVRVSSQPTLAKTGISSFRVKHGCEEGFSNSYMWEPFTGDIDNTNVQYYVELSKNDALDENGVEFNFFKIIASLHSCGLKELSNILVLGVRQNRIKDIKKLKNWVHINTFLKKEVSKISKKDVEALVAHTLFRNVKESIYANNNIVKNVGVDSEYRKGFDRLTNFNFSKGNINSLKTLLLFYKQDDKCDISKIEKELGNIIPNISKTYPLLEHLSNYSTPPRLVSDYINLIDNSKKSGI